jgi:hypothetical protein
VCRSCSANGGGGDVVGAVDAVALTSEEMRDPEEEAIARFRRIDEACRDRRRRAEVVWSRRYGGCVARREAVLCEVASETHKSQAE